jgi:hypothetical protein
MFELIDGRGAFLEDAYVRAPRDSFGIDYDF